MFRLGGRWIVASCVAVVVACVALPASAATRGTEGGTAAKPVSVHIVFTGSGGGRYLDTTRWLEDDTRECYARQTIDDQLSVSWTIAWNAQIVTRGKRRVLVPGKRTSSVVNGSVKGTDVRDYCDEPDEVPGDVGPDWPGTIPCSGALPTTSQGALRTGDRGALLFRGPVFGSPPKPCELSVRNDQLVARVVNRKILADAQTLASSARTVSVPVGTRHPAAGTNYEATRTCSLFPHIYDGIVYFYDCEDTLVWDGTVTFTRTSG